MLNSSRDSTHTVGFLPQKFFSLTNSNQPEEIIDDFDSGSEVWSEESTHLQGSLEFLSDPPDQDPQVEELIRNCTQITLEKFKSTKNRGILSLKKMETETIDTNPDQTELQSTKSGKINLSVEPVDPTGDSTTSGSANLELLGSSTMLEDLAKKFSVTESKNPALLPSDSTELPMLPIELDIQKDMPGTSSAQTVTPVSSRLSKKGNRTVVRTRSKKLDITRPSPPATRSGRSLLRLSNSLLKTDGSSKIIRKNSPGELKRGLKNRDESVEKERQMKRTKENPKVKNANNQNLLAQFGLNKMPSASEDENSESDIEEDSNSAIFLSIDEVIETVEEQNNPLINLGLNKSDINQICKHVELSDDEELQPGTSLMSKIETKAMVHQTEQVTDSVELNINQITNLFNEFKINVHSEFLEMLGAREKEILEIMRDEISNAKIQMREEMISMVSNHDCKSVIKEEIDPLSTRVDQLTHNIQVTFNSLQDKLVNLQIDPTSQIRYNLGNKLFQQTKINTNELSRPIDRIPPITQSTGITSLAKLKKVQGGSSRVNINVPKSDTTFAVFNPTPPTAIKPANTITTEKSQDKYQETISNLASKIYMETPKLNKAEFINHLLRELAKSDLAIEFKGLEEGRKSNLLIFGLKHYLNLVRTGKNRK